jgi:putative Mg2+ transporter-C (MgtC) family protein
VAQHALPVYDFLARLVVAAILGIAIGAERRLAGRASGLQTAGLIATGASLFASIEPAAEGASSYRIIANIVTGVGFLAGGLILRQGSSVSGLNTAATMWCTAAVGALAGLALYREAASAAVAIIAINTLMTLLSRAVQKRRDDN